MATSFIKSSTGATERNTTKEVLNCLRVLQRVLPVVFELESETTRFEMEVLWREEVVEEENDPVDAQLEAQFIIEDDDDDDDEQEGGSSSTTKRETTPKPIAKKTLPSLIERLFSALIDLMFCCGFTLPTKIQVHHHKINYVIW